MLSLFCRGLLSLTLVLLSSVALAKDALLAGERLNANESLISLNGSYRFILQGDGNLVLRNASGSALWASATNGKGGVRLNMQGDGNLVLYTASGSAVWSSKTNGKSAIKAVMQDDGNFVLYTAANAAVWSTNTAKAGGGGGGTPGTGEAVKVAFIGDTGAGTNFQSVLNLIKAEKAQLTVVAGIPPTTAARMMIGMPEYVIRWVPVIPPSLWPETMIMATAILAISAHLDRLA
ncbi:MAG: hypothetical protein IPM37_07520 [Hahellaceae bacterium]|nr:hypothetical protein [Hahellaceae bacterium]